MAVLKRNVTTASDEKWILVYDNSRRKFYVEVREKGILKRHSIERAIKMDGSAGLRLAIVDMFK
jgi:hypothetical protein